MDMKYILFYSILFYSILLDRRWVGPRAGLNTVEKRKISYPARN
jgi:hypothetical protein